MLNSTSNNPATNKLTVGVSQEQIREAVSKSGYPLQTIVAANLRKEFQVQEEWSYIDPDSQSSRTIDILASKYLYDLSKDNPRIRPVLNLLVECKQSELPYVFFLSGGRFITREFPVIAGLFKDEIVLKTDDSKSSWVFPILFVLDLKKHPFISEGPECCATFSKCVRKGNELELSGSDPFNSLVLPILKAIQHFKKAQSPPSTALYFDCHTVFGLAVLDAPMVGIRITEKGEEMLFTPWVRVLRHESYESQDWLKRSTLYGIDILHRDFFPDYLRKHLSPFAEDFSSLALRHQEEIASGKGFASGLEKNSWQEIEKRLRPKK